MQAQIHTLTHTLDVNSMFKVNDFAYSDKKVVVNKSGIPIIKIQDFKPSIAEPRSFGQLSLNMHIKTQQKELKKKILRNSQGFSPACKRKIDRREESMISPLFKQPRDPDKKGLPETCDIEAPYSSNKRKIFEDKIKETHQEIGQNYGRHLSTAQDFQKIADLIANTIGKKNKRSNSTKRLYCSNKKLNDGHGPDSLNLRKMQQKQVQDKKIKISLYELEKNFMKLQRNTIESYLQGNQVEQDIINKDFMTYILENFENKAREKYQLRRNFERLVEREKLLISKRFSCLNRPSSAISERMKNLNSRPQTASTSNFMVQSQTIKHEKNYHLTVKETKRKKKIEESKKNIEKNRENLISDLEGLGEIEKKAILKLYKKFVLYNNTNYEILEKNENVYLNRKKDLKSKTFSMIDDPKFRKNILSPTKIFGGNNSPGIMKSQYFMNQSTQKNSIRNQDFYQDSINENEIKEKESENIRLLELKEEKYQERQKYAEQEKHLRNLKNFTKKFEAKSLSEEELAFFDNIRRNQHNSIKFTLMSKPQYVNLTDKLSQTPLHWAAKRGFYKIASLICECNPNYQAKDILDRTPLEIGITNGYSKISKLLDYKESSQKSAMLFKPDLSNN